ncbi:MAG: LPS export ABC transporter periplasmic protein LptC [Elusimicrobiota bacterium]
MRPSAALALALTAAACAPAAEPPRADRRQTIVDLTLNQSERGRPGWTLRSRLAQLREEQNNATLESPIMDFYTDGKISSRVTAINGEIATDTHDVHLSSAVVLTSYEDHSVLTTDRMVYSSKAKRFRTDSDVVVRRPEGVAYGRGMEATPDLSEIHIYQQHSILSGKSQ